MGSDSSGSEGYSHGKIKIKKDKKDKDKKDKDKKEKKDKDKKDKDKKDKDKKDKDKDKEKHDHSSGHGGPGGTFPAGSIPGMPHAPHQMPLMPHVSGHMGDYRDVHAPPIMPQANIAPSSAPAYGSSPPPPSGYRVPLSANDAFPAPQQAGSPVSYDADGRSPQFIGSALLEKSVQPCKIVPNINPPCLVAYGGGEIGHFGRYDLLPFDANTMEWVHASYGQIPHGRRPIEGGYEESGAKLYHALANVHGVRVPGKTGEHLGGANVSFGGAEHAVSDNYEILCWKY